jgi:hypothetical protein
MHGKPRIELSLIEEASPRINHILPKTSVKEVTPGLASPCCSNMATASLTSVRNEADRVGAVSSGGRRRARGERRLVLWAHGPFRRQRAVDEVVAHVLGSAVARVQEGAVAIAVHGE